MIELPIKVEKIAGAAEDLAACGVFTKKIALLDETVGTIVLCISLEGEGDKQTAVADIFEIFTKKLEDSSSSFLSVLESAAQTASGVGGEALQIDLATCFFLQDVCYIVRVGRRVKVFVAAGEGEPSELTFASGSGHVAAGQIYLLATEELLSFFDPGVLAVPSVDLSEIIDGLATEITHREDQAKVAAIMASVGEPIETEDKVVVEDEAIVAEVDEAVGEEVQRVQDVQEGELDVEITAVQETPIERQEELAVEPGEISARRRSIISGLKDKIVAFFGTQVIAGSKIRRNIFLVAILIIFILVGSVTYAVIQNKRSEAQRQFDQHLTVANTKYGEASSLVSLNKVRAREILVEADREVKEALKIKPKSAEAQKLASDIESKTRETDITTNVELKDLATVDGQLSSLLANGKNFVGVTGSNIYEIGAAGEENTKIPVSSVTSGFVWDNKVFILAGGAVKRVDLVTEKSEPVISSVNGGDIAMFFGNVYVLKTDGIVKVVPVDGGYSQPTEYLETKLNLDADSRMAIDSLIWVTSGDRVLKFNRGKQENFEITGLAAKLGHLGPIYTDSKLSNLYVVDLLNSAVVVVDKDGVYKKTLNSPEFATARDILVNEAEDTVYVAVGSKILKAAL